MAGKAKVVLNNQFLGATPKKERKKFTSPAFENTHMNIMDMDTGDTTAGINTMALARLKFPGRDLLFYAVLATLMIPFPVISIASYVFMLDIHWLSTYQGLILPQIASALDVFIMRQYFLTIPEEVEFAAKIDGLKPWQIFFKISAPMASPAIAAATIFSFISSWNNFLWPLMEVHSLNLFTLPLVLNFFKGANGTQIYWNQMMTVNILTIIPTVVIFALFEKYFIRGISIDVSIR